MASCIVRRFALGGVLASLMVVAACRRDSDTVPAFELDPAEQLSETSVLPHPHGPIVAGKNYVYCATFQLAWNQFQNEILGEPVSLSGSPPMAEALLRGNKVSADILPPDSYLVKAGFVKDRVLGQIQDEMKRRFPNATVSVPESLGRQAAVAYAYLTRLLAFREAYDRLEDPLEFQTATKSAKVASFGVRYLNRQSERAMALGNQVAVLDYVSNDDFILSLITTSKEDAIILAKIPPRETLAATLAAMHRRIKKPAKDMGSPYLEDCETLVVPIVNLNVLRRYGELEGKALTSGKHAGLVVDVAAQAIRFRLDENGARLESSAYLGLKSEASRHGPRQFIFDKPFLLCLKRASVDEPYLAMWIETPELLQRME